MFFVFFFFTGAGRYIPGSGPNPGAPVGVADPFTGNLVSKGTIGTWEIQVPIVPFDGVMRPVSHTFFFFFFFFCL